MTTEEGALPEIQMEESHSMLDGVLPYFYKDDDEVDFNIPRLPGVGFAVHDDIPEHTNVYMFAKFFDKFNLRIGKTALAAAFPFKLSVIELQKATWNISNAFRDTLAIYFISHHFKLRHSSDVALELLPRIEAALDVRDPDQLRAAIFLSNSLCFNDDVHARSLYDAMMIRIVNTALARSTLEAHYLFTVPSQPATSTDCAGRAAIFHDWHQTRKLASGVDLDIGEAEKTRLEKCSCRGSCGRARRGMLRGLKQALAIIEARFVIADLT